MNERQVFATTDRWKGVLAILLVFWLAAAIVHFVFTIDISKVLPSNPIAVGIGLSVLFLFISFFSKRTISCDSVGCMIEKIDFWGLREDRDFFEWNEVTETTFTTFTTTDYLMLFEVKANGQTHQLLTESSKDFGNIINLANEATPHLPYIWVNENRVDAIEKIDRYYKVPRR